MQQEKRKAGVFGWLGILLFVMLVLQPLLILIGLRNTLLEAELDFPQLQERYTWYYFRTTVFLAEVARAAISIIGGILLFKRRRRSSVYGAIIALWASGPIGHAFTLMLPALMYGFGSPVHNILRYSNPLLIATVIHAGYTVYLLLSKRVKLTYPPDGQLPPDEADD
ncbi:MAG: alkaline shock response membrane anchor protein AmaP [Alistipes senegalensis]|nr:alkaline shock response membrane anchor protein AmaP [Oxalobacter formigenes]MCM1281540.1 alkaline shock response membrane anchor protein AmaP [Alistipes senegalensis]